MASEKISDMPAATMALDADVFPIVQGIGNLKTTRAVFLTAQAGEGVRFLTPNGSCGLDPSENVIIAAGPGGIISISVNGLAVLNNDGAGNTWLNCEHAGLMIVGNPTSCHIALQMAGGIPSPDIDVHLDTGSTFRITGDNADTFLVSSAGDVVFNIPAGFSFTINGTGGQIQLDPSGVVQLIGNGGSSPNITFIPGDPGHWSGDPTTFQEAIDRIAKYLNILGGGPIP
jgi:hypothetical protein